MELSRAAVMSILTSVAWPALTWGTPAAAPSSAQGRTTQAVESRPTVARAAASASGGTVPVVGGAATRPVGQGVEDGFIIPAPAPLDDLASGSGWAGPWHVQNSATKGYRVVMDDLLVHPALGTLPARVSGGDQYQSAGRLLDLDGALATVSRPVDDGNGAETRALGRAGSSFFLSVVLRKDRDDDSPVYVGLHGSHIAWLLGDRSLALGFFGEASKRGERRFWSLETGRDPGSRAVLTTDQEVIPGRAVLLVLAVHVREGAEPSVAELHTEPAALGGEPPARPDVSATIPVNELRLRGVGVYLGDSEGSASLGLLRVGPSFASVMLPPRAAAGGGRPGRARGTARFGTVLGEVISWPCESSSAATTPARWTRPPPPSSTRARTGWAGARR